MKASNKTLLAVAMVTLMLMVPFTMIGTAEQSDATSYWPTKSNYTYTMDFSDPHNITVKSGSNVMVSSTSASTKTVVELNALTSHTDQVYKMSDAGTVGTLVVAVDDLVKYDSASSAWVKCTAWTWGSDGVGPFGMFYAAVSLGAQDDYAISTTPGHIAYILDPTNLSYALKYKNGEGGAITSGEHIYTITDYNVMLVIPTVYWSVNGTTLTMGNTSTTGVAYAHTADGTTYPYLAIGVYEAYADDDLGLLSKSGVTSSDTKTIDAFRSYVDIGNSLITDNVGTYQMWNFYEYTLYKIMAQTYISSFDSQTMAGQGANNGHGTGSTNTSGPATTPGETRSTSS
ncbi:MAG: hypothetical protein IJ856_04300 [Candidatus Methanomethylophilaceae archaeon]|nr:hypothetical protein [Candidatus Methanomethylophilaceae archaeon]